MHNNAERYSWTAYHLFVLLSSLIGDSIILYSSFQKDVFKVHQVIIVVIQHIAVSDIAVVILRVFPRMISLTANSRMIGDPLCYVSAYTFFVRFPLGRCLLAVLSSIKLLVLKFPLRAASWTKKTAHLVCITIWILSLSYPVIFYTIDKNDVDFDYRIYSCKYRNRDKILRNIALNISFVMTLAPTIIIIGTTIPTLMYLATARKSARRVGGRDPWQGTLAVALTAIIYLISATTMIVFTIGDKFFKQTNDPTSPFNFHMLRIAIFLSLLNVVSNFYIYTLTMRNFRRFLWLKIQSFQPVRKTRQ